MRWKAKPLICFGVSCAVFLSPLFFSFFFFYIYSEFICCHSTSSCCSRPSNSIRLTGLPAIYTHNTRSKHDHSISVYIPSLVRLRALGHQNCFNLFEVEVIRIAEQVQIQPYSTMELNISEERELSCRINSKSILFWVTELNLFTHAHAEAHVNTRTRTLQTDFVFFNKNHDHIKCVRNLVNSLTFAGVRRRLQSRIFIRPL